jgi:hypothetical protein
MQRGYKYAMANESVQACIEWGKTWNAIVAAMDYGRAIGILNRALEV